MKCLARLVHLFDRRKQPPACSQLACDSKTSLPLLFDESSSSSSEYPVINIDMLELHPHPGVRPSTRTHARESVCPQLPPLDFKSSKIVIKTPTRKSSGRIKNFSFPQTLQRAPSGKQSIKRADSETLPHDAVICHVKRKSFRELPQWAPEWSWALFQDWDA